MEPFCEECGKVVYDDENCQCPAMVEYRAKSQQWLAAAGEYYIKQLQSLGLMPSPKVNVQQPLPQPVVDKFQPYDSIYELTLTIDKDDVLELLAYFNKVTHSAMFEIKGFIACVELTQSGLPHIHALLFSNRKHIDASKVKKLFPYRYTCKKVRLPGNFYEYINKERDNVTVQNYCTAKNIPQIWDELIY